MRLHDAVETVRSALHLGPVESSIYIQLCVGGPAKASDLAVALGLPRTEVYRNASRLLARGLAEMTLERPARYAAVSLERAFDGEIALRLASVDELRAARLVLAPMLFALRVERAPPVTYSTHRVIQGRSEIYAARDRMIGGAQRSIDWATTFPAGVALAEVSGGLDAIAARAAQGVRFRGMLKLAPDDPERLARILANATAEVRDFDIESALGFLIVDGRELLMWFVNDPSETLHAKADVAVLTTAPGFVQAEAYFFEQSWERAGKRQVL